MRVDYCLILAAGFGTRMGLIGKSLPKVMWPIFEKTLLEAQIAYARKFNPEKIYINVHHQSDIVIDYFQKKGMVSGVEFLFEPEILDIGGAIHNVSRNVGYEGILLVLNADQFLFFDESPLFFDLVSSNSWDSLLLGKKFKKAEGYNALLTDNNNRIIERVLNKDLLSNEEYITYTGVSLIRLSSLENVSGASSFFKTVANFSDKRVLLHLSKTIEYWDFGTLDLYVKSIFALLQSLIKKTDSLFVEFCMDNKLINIKKIDFDKNSYNSDCFNVINFSENKISSSNEIRCIVLDSDVDLEVEEDLVIFKSVKDLI